MMVAVAITTSGCSDRSLQDVIAGKSRLDTLQDEPHVATAKHTDGIDPCDLLTTEDISATLDRPVEGPTTTTVDGYCSWTAPLGESVYADSISVNFYGPVEGQATTVGGNQLWSHATRTGAAPPSPCDYQNRVAQSSTHSTSSCWQPGTSPTPA